MSKFELLFPRVAEAGEPDFDAQRELADWQLGESEHRLQHDELDLVEISHALERVDEARFVIGSLNRVGLER